MKLSPRTTTTFTCGLFAVGLLAGCATTPTSTPSPSVSVSREAAWGLRGVNVLLVNNSGQTINLTSVVSDSSNGLGEVKNGGTASIEGTGPAVQIGGSKDVVIGVRFSNNDTLELQAINPITGSPFVRESGCDPDDYAVGDKQDWNFKGRGITIERRADDEWIQFVITFTATKAETSPNICRFDPS